MKDIWEKEQSRMLGYRINSCMSGEDGYSDKEDRFGNHESVGTLYLQYLLASKGLC